MTWHGHVTKALRLLGLLCDTASTLPALSGAAAVSSFLRPSFVIAPSLEDG